MPKGKKKAATIELERRFAHEFVIDFIGSKAVVRAGWVNLKTATEKASDLLQEKDVQDMIRALMSDIQERTDINAERVAHELAAVGFANLGDFVEWDSTTVTLTDSNSLVREQTAAVCSVKRTMGPHGANVEIKLHGKTQALEALQRQLGVKTPLHITGDGARPIVPGLSHDATVEEMDAEIDRIDRELKLVENTKLKIPK